MNVIFSLKKFFSPHHSTASSIYRQASTLIFTLRISFRSLKYISLWLDYAISWSSIKFSPRCIRSTKWNSKHIFKHCLNRKLSFCERNLALTFLLFPLTLLLFSPKRRYQKLEGMLFVTIFIAFSYLRAFPFRFSSTQRNHRRGLRVEIFSTNFPS